MSDVQEFDFQELEFNHDYIQWLFPLPEPSGPNPSAPLLLPEDTASFGADVSLQKAFLQSLQLMLQFYGLEASTRGGAVEITRGAHFDERIGVWLTSGNHNFLRISRMLRSMTLLGQRKHASAFLKCLEGIYAEEPRIIGDTTMSYWRRAVASA